MLHRRIFSRVHELLQSHPFSVQISSSTLLWALGDFAAQKLTSDSIDRNRLFATAAWGACFVGPIGHLWYLNLEKFAAGFLRLKPATVPFIFTKVAADTLIYGPVFLTCFFSFMNFVKDRAGISELTHKMKNDFLPTLAAETAFWPFFQVINFWKVPVAYQLMVLNSAAILDSLFLCWVNSQDDWLSLILPNVRRHTDSEA